jgi:hypothetical protein
MPLDQVHLAETDQSSKREPNVPLAATSTYSQSDKDGNHGTCLPDHMGQT